VEVTYDGTINNDNDKDKDKMWQMEFAIPFTAFSDFHFISRPKAGVRWAFQAVRQDKNYVEDDSVHHQLSSRYMIYGKMFINLHVSDCWNLQIIDFL
jgi:hypothetical protein